MGKKPSVIHGITAYLENSNGPSKESTRISGLKKGTGIYIRIKKAYISINSELESFKNTSLIMLKCEIQQKSLCWKLHDCVIHYVSESRPVRPARGL